jgi:hypothetical protein
MITPDTLRALIERIGISQRHAARLIGISERQMRSYLAAPETTTALEAPAYVGLALEGIMRRIDIIREAVTAVMLADYLTADYGDWLALFADGTYRIYGAGEVPDRDFDALAVVKCPGIGNIDSSAILDGWAEVDEDTGQYVVTGRRHEDRGRVIGDLETAIRECCRGDMTSDMEGLERALIADMLE